MNMGLSVLLLLIQIIFQVSQEINEQEYIVETFESGSIGALPEGWYNHKGNTAIEDFSEDLRQTYKYQIMDEAGNKFLRFDGVNGKHMSYPLISKDNINIYNTPVLSWRWRIHDAPENGNEDSDDRNDVAASIYVVFDMGRVALFKKVPKSIRYTWSSSLEEGTELSKFFGNQKIVVMGKGEDTGGEWKSFERNIVEDYKRLFGDDPPKKPIAILILSDADDTGVATVADYDDIILQSASAN